MKLKVAGYEWSPRNLVDGIKSAAGSVLNPSTYKRGDVWYWQSETGSQKFTWKDNTSSLNAYRRCPPVAAIVNRQARAYVNGKTWILNKKGKEADTPDARKLKALMLKPNVVQTWRQFEAQGEIYQKIYGYNVILIIRPVGFKENIDASALWNITPFCEIEESPVSSLKTVQETKDLIKSITFVFGKDRTALSVDDVFIMRDLSAAFNTILLPQSPMLVLEQPISNIIGALESRGILINNRGPLHVISSNKSDESGNIPLKDSEKTALQEDFKRYGLRQGQWKQIITTANINVQSIGYATKDLMLIEEVADSTRICCDVINFPPFILGLADTTYNNMSEAKKGLYEDSVIPDADNNYEQWNMLFDTGNYNLNINKDYSHLSVFQESADYKAKARKALNEALKIEFLMDLLTVNRWLELNGEDTIGPEGDVRWSEWKKTRGITEPQQIIQNANSEQPTGAAGQG